MPIVMDPGDRSLLVISGALLAVITLLALIFSPPARSAMPDVPTSYSTDSGGAKAAYMLLDELGYKEKRWTAPPGELPADARGVVLILADPIIPASSDERMAIQWFVRDGGRVIATGPLAAAMLNLSHIIGGNPTAYGWKEFHAKLPGPISSLAPSVYMRNGVRWKGEQPEALEYYGDGGGGTVVRFSLGKGTIIWWANSAPLTNYGLKQSSNLELFLNSVGNPHAKRILWDEYFHGERRGFWSFLGKTPFSWALLQAAVLILAALLTYSRRSGPITVPVEESRLSPLEFVETVGDLYARKRAAGGAVEIALQRFRTLLSRRPSLRFGTASGKPDVAAIDQLQGPEKEMAPVLAECESVVRHGEAGEAQALKLVQELHDFARKLRLVSFNK